MIWIQISRDEHPNFFPSNPDPAQLKIIQIVDSGLYFVQDVNNFIYLMKKVTAPDPEGKKSKDPTGPGSSSLQISYPLGLDIFGGEFRNIQLQIDFIYSGKKSF